MNLPAGEANREQPAPSAGTVFAKCRNCGGALACYSIAWSNLPDSEKCRCQNPLAPASPLEKIFGWLFPKDGAARSR